MAFNVRIWKTGRRNRLESQTCVWQKMAVCSWEICFSSLSLNFYIGLMRGLDHMIHCLFTSEVLSFSSWIEQMFSVHLRIHIVQTNQFRCPALQVPSQDSPHRGV